MLPVTLPMMDLYGREMCYRFPDALPTADARTRGYEVGEIVYYPPMHSFVIMYKQNGERFRMQSVGRIEGDVSLFDGIGDIDVSFSRQTATDALTSAATNNLTIRNHGGNLVISGSDLRAALLYDIKGDLIMRTQGSSPLLLSICDRTGVFLLKLIDVAGNESCTTVRL